MRIIQALCGGIKTCKFYDTVYFGACSNSWLDVVVFFLGYIELGCIKKAVFCFAIIIDFPV